MSNLEFDFSRVGISMPALRGVQGNRTFFVVLPTHSLLSAHFPVNLESPDERSQRALDPRHAREISEYMTANADSYSLGAVVYAIDDPGAFEEAAPGSGVGILKLPGATSLHSIDGQHRREGVRMAIGTLPALAQESIAVILYVEPDLVRRRQMFSDMNNTARKVTRALNVAFDSRDPFAVVANELAETHPLLAHRVERELSRIAPGSNNLFTLAAIHDAIKRLFVGPGGRVKDPFKYEKSEIARRGNEFFDFLRASRGELERGVARGAGGLLESSTTLRVIAGALWKSCYDEEGPQLGMNSLVKAFSSISFSATDPLWLESGFVSPGRSTPNARSQEVSAATDALYQRLVAGNVA